MIKPKVVFGGTFDPPHFGHINPLLEAAQMLKITNIFLMPNRIPAHKPRPSASDSQRLCMLKLLVNEYQMFELETFELEDERTSYTYQTLCSLRQANPKQPLVFAMGNDSWMNIQSWFEFKRLLSEFHFIVVNRPEQGLDNAQFLKETPSDYQYSQEKIAQCENVKFFRVSSNESDALSLIHQNWTSQSSSVTFCDTSFEPVSSSEIRSNLRVGKNIESFLPKSVAQYVAKFSLYQK